MTIYEFPSLATFDSTRGAFAPAGEGQIYEISDVARISPIEVTDLVGIPKTSIRAVAPGLTEPFKVDWPTIPKFVWVSGAYTVPLITPSGLEEAARVAADSALAALQELQAFIIANPGGGGGIPAGTTLQDIGDGSSRLAFSPTERLKLAGIAVGATALQLGATLTTAKPGNYSPTPAEISAVRNQGGFVGILGRTAAQGVPTAAELTNIPAGTYIAVDAE